MLLLAVALAVAGVAYTVARVASSGSGRPQAAHASLASRPASYLGVYEAGEPGSYQPFGTFTKAAGRQPNILGYYSGWPQRFYPSFAATARSHGAATIVQMDPTDASVSAIAAGHFDAYLRSYADKVRDFRHPVILGFGHEMNATWYTWGYGHVPPATFVKAWRHIVALFRRQGADNVTWLWTIQADIPGAGPLAYWWPGQRYVTWVGIDGYYYRPADTFASVFGRSIAQVRTLTSQPILLSETAVGPDAGQAAKIQDLFHGMAEYRTLGLIWFDIAQHHGIYHQDWRIEDSPAAERSFRLSARGELAPASPR